MSEEHPFITSLKRLLEEKGMTQEELFLGAWQADREGYAVGTLEKMFYGSRRPALRAMQAMLDSAEASSEQFPEFQAEVVHYLTDGQLHGPQVVDNLKRLGLQGDSWMSREAIRAIPIGRRKTEDSKDKASSAKRRLRGD